MKNTLYIVLFYLTISHVYAQGVNISKASISHSIDRFGADVAKVNIDQLASIFKDKKDCTIDILLDDERIITDLHASEWFNDDIIIKDQDGVHYPMPSMSLYQGKVRGEEHSMVTLSVQGSFINCIISRKDYQIEIINLDGQHLWIENPSSKKYDLACHTDENSAIELRNNGNARTQADCIELMVEADYDIFLAAGSNTSNVVSYINNIFNSVANIYSNQGIPLSLKSISIRTQPDNYPNTLNGCLETFVSNNIGGFDGKIAYLMSGKSLGGGIAHGIGGFCSSVSSYPGPFAVGGDYTYPATNYPGYSSEVMLMAHELGHVMGLRHTHACVWNGDNSQIDDCGNVHAYNNGNTPEGTSCFDANNPILPGSAGTIMSQCHLLAGNAISFSTGFGAQVGAALLSQFANAPCETGSVCSNLPPANDICQYALPLTINNSCVFKTYDNLLATSSGASPGFACGNAGVILDVWFVVTVPESGSFTIETGQATGGLTDMIIQTYVGSCGNLTQLLCDDNAGSGNHALVSISGRSPGEKIYIRIIESGSNASGAFNLCAYDPNLPCHPDFDILVELYNHNGGSSWTNNSGWSSLATNCDVCTWYGVGCDNNGRVISINLANNNLTNDIYQNIHRLPYIQRVDLHGNNLSGTLPINIGNALLLTYLDLGNNNLTGNIPGEWTSATNLKSLYLDHNQLSGTLSSILPSLSLSNLWLNSNSFTGCIPNNYYQLCDRGVAVRLEGNVGLPFGGSYQMLCQDSLGADFDNDGYCGGSVDCDDENALTYPGAPEICDGKDNDCNDSIDDNAPQTTNTWLAIGPEWHSGSNWSTGYIPQLCHDVVIDPLSLDSCIIYANNIGLAGKIDIGLQGVLHIQNFSFLSMNDKLGIVNDGTLSVYGQLQVSGSQASGITSNNVLFVGNSGVIRIDSTTATGLLNTNAFTNRGSLLISNTAAGQQGMIHSGIFENFGVTQIQD